MVFIETSVFTKQVTELLSDDDYVFLQTHLAENPTAGDVIQGTGGLRKMRWAAMGKGKRGGVRVNLLSRRRCRSDSIAPDLP